MPPTPQQGSKTALVTTIVIFAILFVSTTILYFSENAKRQKAQQEVRDLTLKYEPVANDADLTGAYESLRAAATDPTSPYHNQTALSIAVAQRDALAKTITGTVTAPSAAQQQAQAALKAASAKPVTEAGATLPQNAALTDAVRMLTESIIRLQDEKTALNAQVAAAKEEAATILANQGNLLQERDAQIAALSSKYEDATAQLAAYRETSIDKKVQQIEANAQNQIKRAQQAQSKLQQQVSQQSATISDLQREIEKYQNRLAQIRIDPKEGIVQVADGHISRLPGNGVAYIDLGSGDQIAPGMTFEVYDKFTGIPALGDGLSETDMPVGKASIEVIRPGAGSSECRIIRTTPGEQMVEGDLIANLVYDPKTKYNFVVYGEFDLDQNGVTSMSDAQVIKRLITQWGGRTQTEINADTDFVVVGKEPVVRDLSEEDQLDPLLVAQWEEQNAALDAYQDVVSKANQLSIPILNQNRFLYFVGYYSQAPR